MVTRRQIQSATARVSSRAAGIAGMAFRPLIPAQTTITVLATLRPRQARRAPMTTVDRRVFDEDGSTTTFQGGGVKQFLTATRMGGGRFSVTTTDDPLGALEARGLVSPIFGAFIEEPPDLVADGAILFVFPQPRTSSACEPPAADRPPRPRVFVTHGLASVGVMCVSRDEVDRVVARLSEFGAGYECWPLKGNAVDVAGIERMEPPQASLLPDPAERLEFAGLPRGSHSGAPV